MNPDTLIPTIIILTVIRDQEMTPIITPIPISSWRPKHIQTEPTSRKRAKVYSNNENNGLEIKPDVKENDDMKELKKSISQATALTIIVTYSIQYNI